MARGSDSVDTTIHLLVVFPERLSRLLLFVKWLLVIPAFIVLFLYNIAIFITTFVAFWAILFTGRYPSSLFKFARGFMELNSRTMAYYPLLLTDQYPLSNRKLPDRTVSYLVEEPHELSRLMLFAKLVLFFVGTVFEMMNMVFIVLIAFIAIPTWFIILFLGRMPRGIFDVNVAMTQWIARTFSWQYLMRDELSLFATTQRIAYLVGIVAILVSIVAVASFFGGGF